MDWLVGGNAPAWPDKEGTTLKMGPRPPHVLLLPFPHETRAELRIPESAQSLLGPAFTLLYSTLLCSALLCSGHSDEHHDSFLSCETAADMNWSRGSNGYGRWHISVINSPV